MKLLYCFLLFPALSFAEGKGPLMSSQSEHMFAKEEKIVSQGASKQIDQSLAKQTAEAAASRESKGSSDVMIVDPKIVASDWKAAFTALQNKQIQNLVFTLRNQQAIMGVSEINPLPGGYLMLFTINSVKGVRYQIVKTSDIVSLSSE